MILREDPKKDFVPKTDGGVFKSWRPQNYGFLIENAQQPYTSMQWVCPKKYRTPPK